MQRKILASGVRDFAVVVVFLFPAAISAYGDVVFSQSGNDLDITINSPIDITLNTGDSVTFVSFGLVFEDVFSVNQTGLLFATPSSGPITPVLNYEGTDYMDISFAGYSGFDDGPIDANDFFLSWGVPSLVPSSGHVATIGTGTVTISNYFPAHNLPDVSTSTATFASFSSSTGALSAPTNISAVPEPGSFVCLGLIGLITVGYKRFKNTLGLAKP